MSTIEKNSTVKMCTQKDGIELCKLISENIKDAFPALTGGLLYKEGERKDIDIVLYRHRQDIDPNETSEWESDLMRIGVDIIQCYGFVTKAKWKGFNVDIFNPETKITSLEEVYGELND